MRKLIKYLVEKIYAPFLLRYLKHDRYYRYMGIRLLVKEGVFHPGFFFSTKFLLKTISRLSLKDKTLLELGAGSGLISFYAAGKGAAVTASDISTKAVDGLLQNAATLQLPVKVIQSDLFSNIPEQSFDYIIVNPPYYPKNPENEAQMAWFCGADFEYFQKLFAQLGDYVQRNTIVLMSISEDCNVERISAMAKANSFNFTLSRKKRILWEQNYIYRIEY
jgi:release factor glutamine methyltransferase